MRTTLDLPDETLRAAKMLAAEKGVTLKYILRIAIEKELQRAALRRPEVKVSFPVLDSSEPGALSLTNAEIEDLLA
ncbi:MAG: hypothetical protein JO210_10095 [Acidobacteriaceae bacterium]|nr:hypothetical protein [Acidobacteriaceae bacterium]